MLLMFLFVGSFTSIKFHCPLDITPHLTKLLITHTLDLACNQLNNNKTL